MPAPTDPSTGSGASLRSLLRRTDLKLRLEGAEHDLDAGALDAPIRWVHSSDLADPTPFLTEGLALLTTGTQFLTDDAAAYDDYVSRLRARGVRALGFGTEVVREGIPPELAAACRGQRMPLFEVPYRTPFIAVARANAEAVAAEAYARRSWALAAQRALSLAALRSDGLGATITELARQLNTWVGLFDASGALSREHPAGGLDAAMRAELSGEVGAVLRRGARAGSFLRIGAMPFTLQTLGRGGHLRGVVAIAAAELDQEGRGVVTAVIAMAGLALEQNEGLSRARGSLRAGVVQTLLTDDPMLAGRVARDLAGGLPTPPVRVAVTDAAQLDAVSEWLEARAVAIHTGVFFGRGETGLVLAVGEDAEPLLDELAGRFRVNVGVSAPTGYGAFSRAHDQAMTALRRGGPGVTRFEEVAASGLLVALDADEARTVAAAVLAPLVRHDTQRGTELVDSLRAWLAHDARLDAAAVALGVHRHTMRARVALAERLLGTDLGSFAARAELWLALQVVDPSK